MFSFFQCHSMVDYYAPLIFVEIATISPKEVCQKMSICSDSSSLALNRQQSNCDVCESAILEIETHLKDPETKVMINSSTGIQRTGSKLGLYLPEPIIPFLCITCEKLHNSILFCTIWVLVRISLHCFN